MTGKGPVSPDGTTDRGAVSLQRRKSALSPACHTAQVQRFAGAAQGRWKGRPSQDISRAVQCRSAASPDRSFMLVAAKSAHQIGTMRDFPAVRYKSFTCPNTASRIGEGHDGSR